MNKVFKALAQHALGCSGCSQALKLDAMESLAKKKGPVKAAPESVKVREAAKEKKRQGRKEVRAAVRRACEDRSRGRCEVAGCGGVGVELDHFFGRGKAPETVATCWMLCRSCHRDKTLNRPDRIAWLDTYQGHCAAYGYVTEWNRASSLRALEEAQHPARAASRAHGGTAND